MHPFSIFQYYQLTQKLKRVSEVFALFFVAQKTKAVCWLDKNKKENEKSIKGKIK